MAEKNLQYSFKTEEYRATAGLVRSFGLYGGISMSQEMGSSGGRLSEKASSKTPMYADTKGRYGLEIDAGLVATRVGEREYEAVVSVSLKGDSESIERMETLLDKAFKGHAKLVQ